MTCVLFIFLSTVVALLVAIVFSCLPDNIHVYFYNQNIIKQFCAIRIQKSVKEPWFYTSLMRRIYFSLHLTFSSGRYRRCYK
jgi:hypothetical protein